MMLRDIALRFLGAVAPCGGAQFPATESHMTVLRPPTCDDMDISVMACVLLVSGWIFAELSLVALVFLIR
jgi:hypothetical protein